MAIEQKLKEFKRFANCYDKKCKVAIVYDSDPDGLTSAVIVSKAIQSLRGKKPELVFFQAQPMVSLQDSTIEKLKKHNIECLIVLDLAVDQRAEQVKKVEKFARVLVLEHHKKYTNISSDKTTCIKSQDLSFIDPSKYATAKLAYDLYSQIVDIKDLKWLACIGLIGDYSIKPWKKFFKMTFDQTGVNEKYLRNLMEIISYVETVDRKKITALFKEFFKVKRPQEMKNSKYANYKKMVEDELKKLVSQFHKKKEIFPKQELVFFTFKSKLDIKSILINKISTEYYPDKSVVIVEDRGKGIMTISARRQDFRVKMNSLLENAVKNFKDGIAGGHIPAACGKI